MGHQTIRWIANDGQEFNEERDMLLHELEVIDAKEADAFCKENYPNARKQREYANVIQRWQKYQRENRAVVEASDAGKVFSPAKVFDSLAFPQDFNEDIFAQVPQGQQIQRPERYAFDDEDAAIEESFKRATRI